MPRYRSRSYDREMDAYYEYLDEACECYDDYNDYPDYEDDEDETTAAQAPEAGGAALQPIRALAESPERCYYCKRRDRLAAEQLERYRRQEEAREAAAAAAEAKLRANPWYRNIMFFRGILGRFEAARVLGNLGLQMDILRELFTAVLSDHHAFMATHPKFRETVAGRVAHFRADVRAGPMLTELLDQVEQMLEGLKSREDYLPRQVQPTPSSEPPVSPAQEPAAPPQPPEEPAAPSQPPEPTTA